MREPLHIRQKRIYCKNRYNITLEEAEELYSQGCKICRSKTKMIIDHCHKTGKVRGSLCQSCNIRVGKYEKGKRLIRSTKDIEDYLFN